MVPGFAKQYFLLVALVFQPVGVAPLNFRKIPWWKADVQWTESLENRYTVPDRDVAEVRIT